MESDLSLKNLMQIWLPWIYPVFYLAAAVICLTAMRVSSRVVVPGIGFLVGAVVTAGQSLLFHYMIRTAAGVRDFDRFNRYSMILTGASLVGWVLIIVGLVLVFADVRRRLDSPTSYRPPTNRDEPRPWRPRQEGSHDIQT